MDSKKLFLLSPQTDSKEALQLADQNKSVLLSQANNSEKAYQLGKLPDALIWEDKKLVKKRESLQAQLLENRPKTEKDSLRNLLNMTNQEIEQFITKIKKEFPQYAQSKYQQQSISIKEIQQSLDPNSLLIEYVLSKNQVHIFALSRDSCLWVRQELDSKVLQQNTKLFHTILSDYHLLAKDIETSFDQYSSLGHWFYQQLLAPVLTPFPNKQQLIFVTDGTLGHLPFEAFLTAAPTPNLKKEAATFGQLDYLINKYSVSYNYSASLWQENNNSKQQQNNGKMLAMASNYDIHLDSNLRAFRLPTEQWLREKLDPLPAANEEVKALEKIFSGYFAYNKDASEQNIKSKAAEYAIIHLAMHGILDHKRPVLSSLAFTENSDSLENNFWQAHEIAQTTLQADLVVLSACETGYGKFEHGNGIASLARAFMYAGASSLIVSLWQVNDHATSEVMKNLYSNLAEGIPKDEALRLAKLHYIKTAAGLARHPAFWSPFILIGNTTPMHIAQRGDSNWLYYFLALGLILVLAYLFFRQR